MGKFFRKLKRDCKGAVTVFVTLLLIPAVLVSGTGVDLARAYTAKSIVQDANQLAGNSVLASYDALLQNLYGLYGVMSDDEEFAGMVDEYIKLTVFGEDWVDKELGSFQLFYGSELTPGDVTPAADKNLANEEVLRRQIEEYAKFRAPVIIVEEILATLDTFEKVQKDAEIIKDKLEIDKRVEEIDKLYRRIYNCIVATNKAQSRENAAISSVNTIIGDIEKVIDNLYETRTDQYTEAVKNQEEEQAADYEKKYDGLIDNLHSLVVGGKFRIGWINGGYDENGEWQDGYWSGEENRNGLNKSIGDYSAELNGFIKDQNVFDNGKDDTLEELKSLCNKAQEKKAELETLVNNLETKLSSGECSKELSDGLTEPDDKTGKSAIDTYRELLAYDVSKMGNAVYNHNVPQLNSVIDLLQNRVGYGNQNIGVFYSRDALKSWDETDFPINLVLENLARDPNNQIKDDLAIVDGVTPEKYAIPCEVVTKKYESFQSQTFSDTKNPEFFEMLEKLYSGKSDNDKKDSIEDGLNDLLGQIQSQFKGLLSFDPAGAHKYENGSTSSGGGGTNFGSSGDWSEDPDAIKNALDDSLMSRLSSAGSQAVNKVLLLTYDSEMFSCYTTNDGKTDDRPLEENMNGILLSTDVNYYFQSELEYLYNGNQKDAVENLKAVTGMIFLVRFVFNYVASFVVKDVTSTVNTVKASLSWAGPFAIVAGELVRLVMALGESVIDVSRLKNDTQVVLLKDDKNWRFSLSGQLDNITSGAGVTLTGSSFSSGENNDDDETGLRYKDYVRLFLLLVDGNTLAQRTGKLIEMNVTNKKENIGKIEARTERESAMAKATMFDMSKAITDFSITTTVDLKMLFLSMPFAQQGVNGVVPPGTLPITVTDYRGY